MARSGGQNEQNNSEKNGDSKNRNTAEMNSSLNTRETGERMDDMASTPVRERQEAPSEESATDEFPIPLDKIPAVDAVKGRIDELFSVSIEYTMQHQDRFRPMQWMNLKGLSGDIVKAKEYIKAATQPELDHMVELPPEVEPILADPAVHKALEIQTMAVIKFLPDHKIQVSGSTTSVTLATSAIEDKIVNLCVDLTAISSESSDDDIELVSHPVTDRRSLMLQKRDQASERLNDELRRICDLDESILMDEEQLNSIMNLPNDVKRTMISVFNEEMEEGAGTSRSDSSVLIDVDDVDLTTDDAGSLIRPETPDCVDLRSKGKSLETSLDRTLTGAAQSPLNQEPDRDVPMVDISLSKILPGGTNTDSERLKDDVVILPPFYYPGEAPAMSSSGMQKGRTPQLNAEKVSAGGATHTVTNQRPSTNVAATEEKSKSMVDAVKEECERRNALGGAIPKVRPSQPLSEKQLKEFARSEGFVLEDITVALQQFAPNSLIEKEDFRCALEAQVALKKIMEEEVRRMADEDNEEQMEEDEADGEEVVIVAPPVTGQTRERAEGSAARLPQQKKQRLSDEVELTATVGQSSPGQSSPSQPTKSKRRRERLKQKQKENREVKRSQEQAKKPTSKLRPVIIDACNVAMSHGSRPGRNPVFSCRGIQIVIEYFQKRGHPSITGFLPRWRLERADKEDMVDHHIIKQLVDEEYLVCTPSRKLTTGQCIASYDDRYIVRLAAETGGIVVSNDYFRDLHRERREWREVIDTRVLMYSFHRDNFMPPDDPLGRFGPNLDEFLKFPEKNAQNPVLSPRTFARNDPGERPQVAPLVGQQMAPQSRLTAAATTNFHPNVAPNPIPLYNRFTGIGILGQAPQQYMKNPGVNQQVIPPLLPNPSFIPQNTRQSMNQQSYQNPNTNRQTWHPSQHPNVNRPTMLQGQQNPNMNRPTSLPGQQNPSRNRPKVTPEDRKKLEKQLNEICPDSEAKVKKILSKYPQETNANVLCMYLLEDTEVT